MDVRVLSHKKYGDGLWVMGDGLWYVTEPFSHLFEGAGAFRGIVHREDPPKWVRPGPLSFLPLASVKIVDSAIGTPESAVSGCWTMATWDRRAPVYPRIIQESGNDTPANASTSPGFMLGAAAWYWVRSTKGRSFTDGCRGRC